jgi:hypothetical protein
MREAQSAFEPTTTFGMMLPMSGVGRKKKVSCGACSDGKRSLAGTWQAAGFDPSTALDEAAAVSSLGPGAECRVSATDRG